MGYDQPERPSSSGAIVAVLVAVLLILVIGGLFVVGVGAYFWVGTARVQQQAALAEREARMQAERAQAMAEQAMAKVEAQIQPNSAKAADSNFQPDLAVKISEDGDLSINGEQIDLNQFRGRLETMKAQAGSPPRLRIEVDPECPHEHLIAVLDACRDVASEITFRMSSSEGSELATEVEEAEE